MKNKFSRRDFLKMSATAAVTAVAIAACGELFALTSKKPLKIAQARHNDSNFIAQTTTLKKEKALYFEYKDKRAFLVYNDGTIRAFQNICTHNGGPTRLESKKLVCQWHGTNFNPVTGVATKGTAPNGSRLTRIGLKEKDGKIYSSIL